MNYYQALSFDQHQIIVRICRHSSVRKLKIQIIYPYIHFESQYELDFQIPSYSKLWIRNRILKTLILNFNHTKHLKYTRTQRNSMKIIGWKGCCEGDVRWLGPVASNQWVYVWTTIHSFVSLLYISMSHVSSQ